MAPFGTYNGLHHGLHGGRFGGLKRDFSAKKSEWDEDFLAFWARTSGTMNDAWKLAYNSLFAELKAAGIYQIADVIQIYASHNEADARLNILNSSHTATAHNSPSFTAKEGFKGNSSTAYLNTHYNPANDGINWQLNDAGIAVYINEAHSTGTYRFGGGAYNAAGDATWLGLTSDAFEAVNGTQPFLNMGIAPQTGLKSNSLKNGTMTVYINGTAYTYARNPVSVSPWDIYLFNISYANTLDVYPSNPQYSFFFGGASLTSIQSANLEDIIENHMSRIAAL